MKTTTRLTAILGIAIAMSFTFAGEASAHTGHGTSGFLAGIVHPLTGLDHILAMLAIGIWSTYHGEKVMRWMPIVFAAVMSHGAIMAASGHGLPAAEYGSAASVAILGVLLAAAVTLRLPVAFFLTGVFGIFHGLDHGTELAASDSFAATGLGLIVTTMALQLVGVWFGRLIQTRNIPALARGFGYGCAIGGVYLLLAQ
jgi:urease accessory protein